MIDYQFIKKLFSICAHHETILKYNQSIVMHRSAFFLLSTCLSMCHVYLRPNITFYFELDDMKITGLIFSRQNVPAVVGDKK